jgi:hypothetical protein
MKITKIDQNIAKAFSATFMLKLMNGVNTDLFKDIYKSSKFYKDNDASTIKDILNNYYSFLLDHYRNEYVYKNLLISHIKKNQTGSIYSIVTEKNVGKNSRADLSIFSNTSIAYEIKTELDTYSRLDKQLIDYSNAFEYVNVLTTTKKIKTIEKKIDKSFGIKILNDSKEIETIREASSNLESLTHSGIYSLLRQKEVIQLLKRHYGFMPYDFSTVSSRKEIVNSFTKIEIETCHKHAVEILKYRMKYSKVMNLLEKIPHSLLSISLNNQIQNESKAFFKFLNLHFDELDHHIRMMQHRKLF